MDAQIQLQIPSLAKSCSFSSRCEEVCDYPDGIYSAVLWAKRAVPSLTQSEADQLEGALAEFFDSRTPLTVTLSGVAFAISWKG